MRGSVSCRLRSRRPYFLLFQYQIWNSISLNKQYSFAVCIRLLSRDANDFAYLDVRPSQAFWAEEECSSVASQLLNATDSLVTLLLSHGLSSEVAVSKAGPFRQAIWDSGLDPPDS